MRAESVEMEETTEQGAQGDCAETGSTVKAKQSSGTETMSITKEYACPLFK
jgi:hypothetical protein